MALFEKLFGKDKATSNGSNGFENMQPSFEKEKYEAERRQRKLLFIYSGAGSTNEVLRQTDVEVSPDARDKIIDMLAHDEVDEGKKREILNAIAAPFNYQGGSEQAVYSLNNEYERNILALMTTGSLENSRNISANEINAFAMRFPTPMDFEFNANKLVESIRKGNAKMADQYAFSLETFQKKIYGRRYDYWQQMKALDAEADKRLESEWSREWAPGASGYCQASERQVAAGVVTRLNFEAGMEADNSCADSLYYNPDRQLYGVFDGVNGEPNARGASSMAAEILSLTSDKYPDMRSCSSLASVLNSIDMSISNMAQGKTTGAIATPIDFNGYTKLSYASVGNSSIYVIDEKGNARKITSDKDGVGIFLQNSLGMGRNDGNHFRCSDYGQVDISPKSIVAIITDGINSGYKEEGLSENEIGRITRRARGPQDAARRLVERARSNDDRTAVVFVPDFDRV